MPCWNRTTLPKPNLWRSNPRGYNGEMTSENDHANAIRLLKALVARGASSKEPMAHAWITHVALEVGLAGDEFDSALDYAADQGWFDDAEVTDNASWVSLTPAGEGAGESG
jgi:hypothetical protein